MSNKILIGSTFPLGLVRRPVTIVTAEISQLVSALADAEIHSFWGHENTRATAERVLGISLATHGNRPALLLSPEKLPMLNETVFQDVWVFSPDYTPGFRPALGEEVPPEKISGWQVLHLNWNITP